MDSIDPVFIYFLLVIMKIEAFDYGRIISKCVYDSAATPIIVSGTRPTDFCCRDPVPF